MAKSLDIIDPKKELAPRDEREDNEEEGESPRQERSGGGVFYLILGIIAVVVSTSLAVYILFKDNKDDAKTTSPSASATVGPTTTTSTTATASATTSATATTSVAATTTFNYTDESIRIVNGNGKSGEASRIKASLEAKGYTIASTGNASKSYDKTTILYKAGEQALAEALKSAIAADYAATVQLSDQATLGSYDAVIALGAE